MTDIQGACPILTTPFDDDRRVDESSLRNIVQTHVGEECSALVLFSLASEFYKLTDAERDRIATVTIDECADTDTAVIYSVTDHATNVAVDHAIAAEETGADVLMILALLKSYWFDTFPTETAVGYECEVLNHPGTSDTVITAHPSLRERLDEKRRVH